MIQLAPVLLGCDPELFLMKHGKVIGAEKVIPEEGLRSPLKYGAIVLDGVQFEIHTNPKHRPDEVGRELSEAFLTLRSYLSRIDSVSTCFNSVVTVDREELDTLDEKARVLGCAPSLNIYGHPPLSVDGTTYLKRSGGGHVQLGLRPPIYNRYNTEIDNREDLVVLMDVLVGNTCVMIDRDPEAPERRLYYGRAGEYRLPQHGLEYRTLSNFWLRSYQLMSFVFEMSSLAVSILHTALTEKNGLDEELMKDVDIQSCREAINGNDLQLAKKNYSAVHQFIAKHSQKGLGLHVGSLQKFDCFLAGIEKHGIEYWFPEDPLKHWCDPAKHVSFDTFLMRLQ